MDTTRIDKWLWAARFFKTRSLATEAIQQGKIRLNQQGVKPSREIRVGDVLTIYQSNAKQTIVVRAISALRGPAPVAQLLYLETPESAQSRTLEAQRRRLNPEPALTIEHGRPTKRDRRKLDKGWDSRWSARIES
jgi:ribosome-associated heat shock protein Hsp15